MASKSAKDGAKYDPKAGKASFEQLLPRIKALPAAQVLPVNADLQFVAVAALRVAADVTASSARTQFAKMPGLEIACVDDLEKLAWATWYASTEAQSEAATASTVKIPVDLLDEETARRQRMLKVLDYHLGDDPRIAKVLASIRAGSGYRDLASDLTRCATLYETHEAELEGDKRDYHASDVAAARKGAKAILEALGQATRDSSWADKQARCWTLLLTSYNEVRAAAQWLYRADSDVDERFPSLYAAGRVGVGRPRKGQGQPPPPPPPPDGDGGADPEG